MQQQIYGLKTGIFGGSGNLVFNRFTGPGRVGIQSAYVHLRPRTDRRRPGRAVGGHRQPRRGRMLE